VAARRDIEERNRLADYAQSSEARFSEYVDSISAALGRDDRAQPLKDYLYKLILDLTDGVSWPLSLQAAWLSSPAWNWPDFSRASGRASMNVCIGVSPVRSRPN
jgi:hypothetical protein